MKKKVLILTKSKMIFLKENPKNDQEYLKLDAFYSGWHEAFQFNQYEVCLDTRSLFFLNNFKYCFLFLYRMYNFFVNRVKIIGKFDNYFLKKSILKKCISHNIQIIFTEINSLLDQKFLLELKKNNIFTIEWFGLFPSHVNAAKNNSLKYLDMILTPGSYEELFNEYDVNKKNIFAVGSSFNPRFLYHEFDSNYAHDIVFIGGISKIHSNRIELLEKIAEKFPNFAFYGYGIEDTNPNSILRLKFKGWANDKIMRKAFSSSKIALNLTLDNYAHVKKGFNNRLHEICACNGALQIVTKNKNIDELFTDNPIIQFETIDDVIHKIEYYLANENERKSAVEKCYIENSKFSYLKNTSNFFKHLESLF